MKLLEEREVSIQVLEEQSRGIDKNVLVVSFCTHLVLESLPAVLILDGTVTSVLVDVLKELQNLWNLNMFRHPLQEVLNTNHMKGEEAFLIFVFFVVATVEHINTHLIDLADGMEPESLLLTLGTSLLIADLNDVSDQGIKLHDVHLVRLSRRCLSTL